MLLAIGAVSLLFAASPTEAQENGSSPRIADLYRDLLRERTRNIERLRQYTDRAVYPRNYDFADKFMPYFVDVHGTHCAMAHLVRESGATDIVRQVTALNNNIFVDDVKSGPFADWILSSGLTQAECARIQPRYPPRPKPPVDPIDLARPKPDPDDQRVKQHLAQVQAELAANTFRSVNIAVAVLAARHKEMLLGKSYAVIAPPAEKTAKASLTLKNLSKSRQMEVVLTFFNGSGEIVQQTIPGFQATASFHEAMFAVNQEVRVPYNCDNTWVVVEWTAGPGLNITVPFVTVADVKPMADASK